MKQRVAALWSVPTSTPRADLFAGLARLADATLETAITYINEVQVFEMAPSLVQ